ncbi:hypothetical protein SNOG_05107 [Parastagonospora nodorum SN15]|uniref:Uncharacterized protein n=1 Tax=Phaeosphaeria nodorum (strain SN15 / ATCC MYA-4574 / FGSC 10173) TaxID=321614 RepID=Q0UT07_PHANO|nr:hypothetical protein SNOG_05107 [Parastagonospora nodorum SN15]EAT87498.1 hypothetical protein SNOG_05107 [Parastagonospora nodorum SN15]
MSRIQMEWTHAYVWTLGQLSGVRPEVRRSESIEVPR